MSEKQQREPARGANPAQKPDTERKAPQSPAAPVSKQETKPVHKPGPSVDIGPGPGADVVATPPHRI